MHGELSTRRAASESSWFTYSLVPHATRIPDVLLVPTGTLGEPLLSAFPDGGKHFVRENEPEEPMFIRHVFFAQRWIARVAYLVDEYACHAA